MPDVAGGVQPSRAAVMRGGCGTLRGMSDGTLPELSAEQVIERVLWAEGITGDRCARVALRILRDLDEAGYRIDSPEPQ